ncbi:MATE family efflux transporter [Parvularcula sp. IMCC14364]|uniref:MATE family efflux transporter n=1 Tax=Parvularcula sp. IMCC14364 TaxID=3067902 RepID=UPI002740453D|nr:MATE family efflux transporter [Parvularcula sp. IMCC14364]
MTERETKLTTELRDNADIDESQIGKPMSWRKEFSSLLLLGFPLALTQLVQFSISTIDLLMIGQLGAEALASASLGLAIFYATWLVGFGPMMAVTPLVSQTLGADPNNTRDVRISVRMGLWAIIITFPMMFVIYFFSADIALMLGQAPHISEAAGNYILALAPGMPFALGVFMLRNFLAAIDRTRVPLAVIIIVTLLNTLLNWILIYGNWGAPAWGLVGAGIASSLSHIVGFLLLTAYIQWDSRGREFELFDNFFRLHTERLREIFKLGLPISVTFGFEVMLFNVAVFLMGLIGVYEQAAYQSALNVAALAFMMPLGFSMAGCVRVGLAAGAKDQKGIRKAAGATIAVCLIAIMSVAVFVVLFPREIARFYLDADEGANTEVLRLIASFLPIAAAFMFFDGIQVAAGQVLRGLKDVNSPMYLTGISYWLIGFPVSVYFGLYTPVGAIGVWWGLLAGLAAASILLGGRLLYLLANPEEQPG